MSVYAYPDGDDLVSVTTSPTAWPGEPRALVSFGPTVRAPRVSLTISRSQAQALMGELDAWLTLTASNVTRLPPRAEPAPDAPSAA